MATPHVTGAVALCLSTGHCVGTPAQVKGTLLSDAAGMPASYGFAGDPNNPITTTGNSPKTLYYGYLVYGGY
jgi:subtilisin family serine protease